ncbi:MAG: hypothetical protein WDM76_10580 [Limisphaerales bacterium]
MQQQIAQLQSANGSLFNRPAAAGDSKKLPDEQFNELLRLRGEVGSLRTQNSELKKLQNENLKLSRKVGMLEGEWNNVTNNFPIHGPYLNREAWSDAGTAKPINTLESLLWALRENNEDKISELVFTNALNLKPMLLKGFWEKVKGVHIINVAYINDNSGQQKSMIDTIVEQVESSSAENDIIPSSADFQSPAVRNYLSTRQTIRRWFLKQIDGQWEITGMQ